MNRETPRRIPFMKMTGTGNDFILIDNRNGLVDADHCRDLVRQACRRKLSVGADGLILIENDPEVDFKWRFFNADASEAEMCGNGARCAARFARLKGIVARPQMLFRTLAGVIRAEIHDRRVKVQMTPPHSLRTGIELDLDGNRLDLDFINTGVPHAVSFAADENALESIDVDRRGRAVRFHAQFQPAGTNVDFVWVKDAHSISVRTYERGVEGETLACGTGAIASALVAAVRDRVHSPVEVRTRSGEFLTIYYETEPEAHRGFEIRFREVCLEGEARVVYEADLWDETL
jgi:diaminopimelate epimerase